MVDERIERRSEAAKEWRFIGNRSRQRLTISARWRQDSAVRRSLRFSLRLLLATPNLPMSRSISSSLPSQQQRTPLTSHLPPCRLLSILLLRAFPRYHRPTVHLLRLSAQARPVSHPLPSVPPARLPHQAVFHSTKTKSKRKFGLPSLYKTTVNLPLNLRLDQINKDSEHPSIRIRIRNNTRLHLMRDRYLKVRRSGERI